MPFNDIPPVRSGANFRDVLTSDNLNTLRKVASEGYFARNVTGRNVVNDPSGAYIRPQPKQRARGSAGPTTFRITDATAAETPQVKIAFGQISGITPTIDEVPLDDPAVSTLEFGEITDGIVSVWAEVTTDENGVATEVAIGMGLEVPVFTTTVACLVLGTVILVDDKIAKINQAIWYSLSHSRCYGYGPGGRGTDHRFVVGN